MKKNINFGLILMAFAFALSSCGDLDSTNKDSTSSGSSVVYLPKITDLQRDNLKGKVATVLLSGNKKTYSASGFITGDSTSIFNYTYEYNTSNIKIKETKKNISNGVTTTKVTTYTYNDKNLLTKKITTTDGTETENASCTINGSKSICYVVSKKIGIFYDTISYNANNSIIKVLSSKAIISSGEFLGSRVEEYDENYQLLTSEQKVNASDGSAYTYSKYVYNSSYLPTSYKVILNSNGVDLLYRTYNYGYGTNGFVSSEKIITKTGTETETTYSNYILDSNGNWTKRDGKLPSGTSFIEERTITYYQ